MKRKPPDRRAQARRAALNALRRASRAARRAGLTLSNWEGEFLSSVENRVETFGRAFADPQKGESGAALSTLQRVKLREIAAKARGKDRPARSRSSPAAGRWPKKS